MKRYIRTKNGKIFDTKEIITINGTLFCGDDKFNNEAELLNEILKQADTIEELIYDNDLTDLGYWKDIAYKDEADIEITELYTKQGNNYILAAKKEKGEWRVI